MVSVAAATRFDQTCAGKYNEDEKEGCFKKITPILIDATLYEVKENKDEEGTVYTGKRKSNRVTFI